MWKEISSINAKITLLSSESINMKKNLIKKNDLNLTVGVIRDFQTFFK